MSTQDQARKLIAKDRLHDELIQENMLTRASAEVEEQTITDTEEKARELLVEERLHQDKLEENMLTRSVEEIEQ